MEISSRKSLSRKVFAIGLVIAVSGVGAEVSAAEQTGHYAVTALQARERSAAVQQQEEKIRRIFAEQDKQLETAEEFRQKAEYESAVKIYETVLRQLENMTGELALRRAEAVRADLKSCNTKWAQAVLQRTRMAIADKRYADAISIAAEVTEHDPELMEEAGELIEYCRQMLQGAEFRQDITLAAADPDYQANQEKITKLFAEAKTFYNYKRYDEARNRLEQIFIIDPYNVNAISLMEQLYNQYYTYGLKRHQADVASLSAYADWQWAEPVFPAELDMTTVRSGDKTTAEAQDVLARMDRIIFPTIEIDDADIMSVIRLLNKYSKLYDPDKVGVSVSTGITVSDLEAMGPQGRVTINFSRIPMSAVLRYICQDTGLKYRIEENGIFIGSEVDEMQTRSFKVRGNLISGIAGDPSLDNVSVSEEGMGEGPAGIEGKTEGEGEGKSNAQTFFSGTGSKAIRLTEAKLKRYFELRGIKFQAGASISYNKRSSRLYVRNTLENLRRMDELIRQLDAIETPLVMVEVKSVEINEGNMQDLGFNWSLDQLGATSSTAWAFGQGENEKISITRPNTLGKNNESLDTAIVNNWDIFPALFGTTYPFGSDSALSLKLTINALSRNSYSETLSAPKVMASNGTKAAVKMVTAYYFPSSWEEYEIEDDDGNVTITPPTPEFEDETEVGIVFDVTPSVNPDNRTIALNIDASVTNYLEKDETTINVEGVLTEMVAPTDPTTGAITGTLRPQYTPVTYTYTVWMPVITRRNVRVNVTVYDGETIVLGGMVDNTVKTKIDKWPILSDLPLIGRFFQAETESMDNTNLLIFVTTRLVSNDGVPIHRDAVVGAPDFNR